LRLFCLLTNKHPPIQTSSTTINSVTAPVAAAISSLSSLSLDASLFGFLGTDGDALVWIVPVVGYSLPWLVI